MKSIYLEAKQYKHSYERSAIKLLEKYNIDCSFSDCKSKYKIKQQVKYVIQNVENIEQQIWYKNLWDDTKNPENGNKLRLYRLFKERIHTEHYAQQNMPREWRKYLARLRSGSLQIKIETGRYENIPLSERLCSFCNDNHIEDEVHVLLSCTLYDDLRYELLEHMNNLSDDFRHVPTLTKFCRILTTNSAQVILAKFIYNMIKRRKSHDIF